MRNAGTGKYYLGMVSGDSQWCFDSSEEATKQDACNQFTHIDWVTSPEADESIAGIITTSFMQRSALQRIYCSGADKYSRLIYNKCTEKKIFSDVIILDTRTDGLIWEIYCFHKQSVI